MKKDKPSFDAVKSKLDEKGEDSLTCEELKVALRHLNEKRDKKDKIKLKGTRPELLERFKANY